MYTYVNIHKKVAIILGAVQLLMLTDGGCRFIRCVSVRERVRECGRTRDRDRSLITVHSSVDLCH